MGYVATVFFVLIGLLMWLTVTEQLEFNAWNRDCNGLGGQISQTNANFLGTEYECFIDGEQIEVPGWEGKS